MKYTTICDMGSIKIFSNEMSCFFDNGFGDGETEVEILEKNTEKTKNCEFLGHFSVKKKNCVFLSSSDCDDDKIHTFGIGRWFVYRRKEADMVIVLEDKDIHA